MRHRTIHTAMSKNCLLPLALFHPDQGTNICLYNDALEIVVVVIFAAQYFSEPSLAVSTNH